MRFFKTKSHEDILDTTLYELPDSKDKISYADANEGTAVFGATGSGKTSGVANYIAKAMLQQQFGMCILCSKKKERADWIQLIEKHAPERMKDVVVLNKESHFRFNFLEYEMTRTGEGAGDVLNAIEALMGLNELNRVYLSGGEGGKDERFWDLSLRQFISRIIATLRLAGEAISIINMRRLAADSFKGDEAEQYQSLEAQAFNEKIDPVKRELASAQLQEWIGRNYFLRVLLSIVPKNEEEQEEMSLITNYWLREFPKIGERANSIILTSFMGIVQPFLNKGILKSHFSSGLSEAVLPENCYLKNSIVILDFPVKEFGVAALYAAMIYKTTFQTCMERRDVELETDPKPVGLFIDEYQQFCSYKSDVQFQATARSSWVATVYISQNLDGIVNVMGGTNAQEKAKSLLGNLNLKFFFSNGNYSTNTWAANMIGKHLVDYENFSMDADHKITKSKNQHREYRITPDYFTTLKTGRKVNKYIVEAIVFKAGRTWGREQLNFAKVGFRQG
ncbi:hypothetical protein DVK85_01470 [Flavobacterium arcticum]|uniref:TraD/TraG TraM recognition site domain-containing protein n=1 Tax=Flavobacterium arcticum TaxID=1784713 RepID=A0A345H8R1_9FLAO|nr:TraM recognition domain-containing protein [Flavobacterium arcticum]AXG72971.1 hypothetical protein DVK85_01470 [Flavobacterium arcticum]KAF2510365.1 TraM recognition domain-containing protein [Flavobacterium arcticum]